MPPTGKFRGYSLSQKGALVEDIQVWNLVVFCTLFAKYNSACLLSMDSKSCFNLILPKGILASEWKRHRILLKDIDRVLMSEALGELLGQLRRSTGDWGRVIHWMLVCNNRSSNDARKYLRGMAVNDRQGRHPWTGKPASPTPVVLGPDVESLPQESNAPSEPHSLPDPYKRAMANVRLILGPSTHVGKGLSIMHEVRAWLIERVTLMIIDAQVPTNMQVWQLTQAIEHMKEDVPYARGQSLADGIFLALAHLIAPIQA